MKKWYQSRTIQVAIAQGILGVITAFVANDPALESLGALVVIKSILDFFLRLDTIKGLE